MVKKHPEPTTPTPMPALPPGWADIANTNRDLSNLNYVLKDTDPNVGIGPRPNFLLALYN